MVALGRWAFSYERGTPVDSLEREIALTRDPAFIQQYFIEPAFIEPAFMKPKTLDQRLSNLAGGRGRFGGGVLAQGGERQDHR